MHSKIRSPRRKKSKLRLSSWTTMAVILMNLKVKLVMMKKKRKKRSYKRSRK